MGGSVLARFLVHHVAGHEHGDEVTGGEAALVSLEEEGGAELSLHAQAGEISFQVLGYILEKKRSRKKEQ